MKLKVNGTASPVDDADPDSAKALAASVLVATTLAVSLFWKWYFHEYKPSISKFVRKLIYLEYNKT